ncbi:MAG: hypothetical protein JWM73_638 [Solirubrobacterales bacterium]|nr:hypothetical protein [Solirubrobacterales bacterium]
MRTVLFASALLLVCCPAASALTTTTIGSPAEGSTVGPVAYNGSGYPFTVSGTSDGTTGDLVDLRCYYANVSGVVVADTVQSNVAINVDGTFTTSAANAAVPALVPCLLRAVPSGLSPTGSQLDPFHAVRITAAFQRDSTDAGKTFDYDDNGSVGRRAWVEMRSLSGTSLGDGHGLDNTIPFAPVSGAAPQQLSTYTFYGNGFYQTSVRPASPSVYRSSVQIDGQDGFFARSAESIQTSDPWPGLTVSRTFDPASGTYTTTENDTLSRCPSNVTNATTDSSNCNPLSATDVSVHRTMKVTYGGLMVSQADTWSTTGAARAIDLFETQEFQPNSNHNGYEFPGQPALAAHTTAFEAVPIADPGRPASMLYTYDMTKGDDITNPRASISMWPLPDEAVFVGTNDAAFLFHYAFTIPAGGSFTVRKVYASEVTSAALAPLTSAGEGGVVAPTVAISAPAEGATVAPGTITVSGSTSPGTSSVSVNGVAATLGDVTWSAQVPVALGAVTLTAVATNDTSTASASRSITVVTPPAVVPPGGGGGPPPPVHAPARPHIAGAVVSCPAGGAVCTAAASWRRGKTVVARRSVRIVAGAKRTLKPALTKAGRKLLRTHRRLRVVRRITARAGSGTPVVKTSTVTLRR